MERKKNQTVMAEILYSKNGTPLIAYGNTYHAITSGTPAEKIKKSAQPKDPDEDKFLVGNYWIADWSGANNFPTVADEIINSVGVLNTGLKFTRNFTLGQGIFACKVIDYDESGNEILQRVKDKSLIGFANSRVVRRYLSKALRDYLKFGCAFVEIIMNAEGDKIVGINTVNAKYCRLTIADEYGSINNCIVSGKWPDCPGEGQYKVYDVLDEHVELELSVTLFGVSFVKLS